MFWLITIPVQVGVSEPKKFVSDNLSMVAEVFSVFIAEKIEVKVTTKDN